MNIRDNKNSTIYFTITGMHHHLGGNCAEYLKEIFKQGSKVKLVKEHDNEYDNEAILVKFPGLGKVGYVANSVYTVLGESYSAGRLYDKFDEETTGTVYALLPGGIICTLNK